MSPSLLFCFLLIAYAVLPGNAQRRRLKIEMEIEKNAHGTVKWFNDLKGFGFIVPEQPIRRDGKQDLFVHISSINTTSGTLHEGDRVIFDLEKGEKPSALNVRSNGSDE